MIDAVGHIPKVQKLHLDDIKTKICSTRDVINAHLAAVPNWDYPVLWKLQKVTYFSKVDAFRDAVAEVRRHAVSVGRTYEGHRAAIEQEKGVWRGVRTKFKNYLIAKGVSECVAKAVADAMWSHWSPPGKKGITLEFTSPVCELKGVGTLDDFADPFIIRYDSKRLESDATFYQNLMARMFTENKQTSITAMRDCVGVMKNPANALTSAVTGFPPAQPLSLDPAGDATNKIFNHVQALNLGLWTSWCASANVSLQSWPWAKIPMFAQLMVGSCVMIVVDAESVAKMGEMSTALETADSTALKAFPAFVMVEGDAVWIPHGAQAIICGVSPQVKWSADGVDTKNCKPNQYHSIAVATFPVFDEAWTEAKLTQDQRLLMASSWVRARAWMPTSWTANKQVQAWVEMCSKDSSAAPAAAVASVTDAEL